MTIAIALKVGDCLVLGADSASTLSGPNGVVNVYFNAEKIFNLRKGLPIGAVTYGLGNLDSRSVTALAKDLRERFTDEKHAWHLDPDSYSLEAVVDRMVEFFHEEYYLKEWPQKRVKDDGSEEEVWATMGFLVGGYSAGKREGEVWNLEIDTKGVARKSLTFGMVGAPNRYGIEAKGQPEAIYRLVAGYSPAIVEGLVVSGVARDEAVRFLQTQGIVQVVQPGMPMQDAIDLVKFMCDVTAGFVQFIPGAPTVHPPIDLASMSYHEGFRWVRRKHYFTAELNPPMLSE